MESTDAGSSFVEVMPDELPWRDSYKLLIGSIVPRPIAFVSTVDSKGVNNLAAFSFFNGVCPKPFIVSFAPMRRGSDAGKKDTLRNIEETHEFVVNVVNEALVSPMSQTNPEFPPDVDEFQVAGLTPIASHVVKPPRVLESPIQMECELVQVVHLGEEIGAGSLVLGRVVKMHIAESVYEDGKIDPAKLQAVGRMAGDVYARTTDRFAFKRSTSTDRR
ncbi:flavin reductase family protein [Alicyclobacillus mengziensis]|uniref:flavin reductase family protein n=1 Tax=Alicyclobacillus mengziensis TaxID=2931921 RepID=UPI0020132BC7|nr:flavin reductase family protein [Alicyclobacillus mengziensis]